MNYILFSPLEQFEFITIGMIPEFSILKINNIEWLNAIDHSTITQEYISKNYIQT